MNENRNSHCVTLLCGLALIAVLIGVVTPGGGRSTSTQQLAAVTVVFSAASGSLTML